METLSGARRDRAGRRLRRRAGLPGLVRAAALSLLGAALALSTAAAQEEPSAESDDWDVTRARGETRTIDFTTDRGTWMSVDVSPDGDWILFDLMDHVYRMPAEGGEATPLTQESGVAVNFDPRYSPDGRQIAFVSDREGQNNLWLMDADGSAPRPVFVDPYVQVSMPVWTPDGEYIVVRRRNVHPENESDDDGLWIHHRDGGEGMQLIGEDDGENPSWPSISSDGRYLYYHVSTGGGAPLSGHLQLRRYEFETGEILELTAGEVGGAALARLSSGGAFAPEVSPDGRSVAFGRRVPDGTISYEGHEYGPRTALWLRDASTGAERKVMDPIAVATRSSRGILPGYTWTPDGGSILISQGGRIRRLHVESGEVEEIPFQARVRRTISERAAASFRITDEPFQPRFLRWQSLSPDASMLAFQAVGQVWVTEMPDGTPRTVTGADARDRTEFSLAWSPDGRSLAFTTLDTLNRGHVWTVPVEGGEPERLTEQPGFYTHVAWSPDGRELVATRGGGATMRGRTVAHDAFFEIVRIPADGGPAEPIATIAQPADAALNNYARRAIPGPSYGPGDRIFFPAPLDPEEDDGDADGDDPVTALVSVDRDGRDRRVHMTFPHADAAVPSPGGGHVAFEEGDNVYLVPFPGRWRSARAVHVERRDSVLPVKKLTERGGIYPRWHDGTTLEFGNANWHYTYDVTTGEKDSTRIELTVPTERARGTVAFVGARIITMDREGPGVIAEGTVVAEDGRIRCVGAVGTCDTSDADRTIDARGNTIMPGIIDMHAHHYRENRGHRPPNDYEVAIYLAYGVTTNLDNSMWAENIFPAAERIRAGRMVGPRTFSTGDPLYQGDGPSQNRITSYEDAEDNVLRLRSWGAVAVKQYSHPRRDQRQWIIDAARRAGMMVTGHWNPGIVMDGHTGIEHAREFVPLYRDMTTFYGRAGVVYSPTIVVSGPGPANLEYWFADDQVWRQEKQQRWMPWRMRTFLRWRTLRPETDYSYPLVAQGLRDIIDAGGYGAVGGHGEHHALTPHWEIWMMAEALGRMGALEVATIHGANFLGAEEDVGSIEPGKLADLLVLNSDPLEDIRSTADIRFVVKDGTVYEAETLDEVWPNDRPFGPYYWLDPDATAAGARPVGR